MHYDYHKYTVILGNVMYESSHKYQLYTVMHAGGLANGEKTHFNTCVTSKPSVNATFALTTKDAHVHP